MMEVYIGCSGWNYRDWKGNFYPENIPQKEWLEYYMEHFNTVEVNNTFYRTPKDSTVVKWKKQAYGKDFNFTLKGNRYVTQMKKLHDVEDSVEKFYHTSDLMKTKLGCVLWQLPPSLHRDDEKLENFCKLLKGKNVIEFRHESWFDEEVYDILRKNRVSYCSISTPKFPEKIIATTDTVYLRMHGKGKKWYDYDYSKKELKSWHKKIIDSGAKEVFIYFNNDIGAVAPENAKVMQELFDS
ncbi:DUF72 domain-containing protein [Christiangramia fulva]|uniref:DUF72 domain-containing protein n=1 Tax=Christiangramia fulva TaxID=2126553 RepID=A0A2R3Z4F2_9FLAO|nr:DUF72 domain-containing protein [Christiangramia fulva]AVR45150.1 DUF72 domain-containing protein [Christiangramia fulva]